MPKIISKDGTTERNFRNSVRECLDGKTFVLNRPVGVAAPLAVETQGFTVQEQNRLAQKYLVIGRPGSNAMRRGELNSLIEANQIAGAVIVRDGNTNEEIDRTNDLRSLEATASQRTKVCLIHLDPNAKIDEDGIKKHLKDKAERPTEANLNRQILRIKPEDLDTILEHLGKILNLESNPVVTSPKPSLETTNSSWPSAKQNKTAVTFREFLTGLLDADDPNEYKKTITINPGRRPRQNNGNGEAYKIIQEFQDNHGTSFDKLAEWMTDENLTRMGKSFTEDNYLWLLNVLLAQMNEDNNLNTFRAMVKEIQKLQSSTTPT